MPPFSPAWENIHALSRTQATEEETEDFPLILIHLGGQLPLTVFMVIVEIAGKHLRMVTDFDMSLFLIF